MNLWKIPNNLATNGKFHATVILLAVTALVLGLVDSTDKQIGFKPAQPSETVARKPVASTAESLLRQSAVNLADGPALEALAKMHVNLFGESMVSDGAYSQMGRGSGAARLEFIYGDGDDEHSVIQICNRGFFYRLKTGGLNPQLQTIDLRRLAHVDRQRLFADQSTWMATGGLASLLKKLADNFSFEAVQNDTYSDTAVFKLVGHWKEEKFKRMMFGQIRYDVIKDSVNWDRVRNNIPQRCEILLGNDDYFPLFPYRVTFFRDIKKDEVVQSVPTVVLQLYELTVDPEVAAEKFEINSDSMAIVQLTDGMVQRIEKLNRMPRSARSPAKRTSK